MYLKNRITIVATVLCVMFFASCGSNSGTDEVQIKRFEKVLFGTAANDLPKVLKEQELEYAPLISGDLNDPYFMQSIVGFATDPQMVDVYNTVMHRYPYSMPCGSSIFPSNALIRVFWCSSRACSKTKSVERTNAEQAITTSMVLTIIFDVRLLSHKNRYANAKAAIIPISR